MAQEKDNREQRGKSEKKIQSAHERTDRRDHGEVRPGYSNETGDLDRVKNGDRDATDAGLDALDTEVDPDSIKGDDLDHLKGHIPGRSDLDAGEVERGPESGRGSRGKASEGGEISGV